VAPERLDAFAYAVEAGSWMSVGTPAKTVAVIDDIQPSSGGHRRASR
jgi:hypothetical protein